MSLCVDGEKTCDLVFFRQRLQKRFINFSPINRRGHVTLHYYTLCVVAPQNSPRAHFMLHYYILREAARLIGRNVRGRQLIAKPNSTVSVDSQGVGSGDSLCALRVGAAFDRSRYNQSERRKSFYFSLT